MSKEWRFWCDDESGVWIGISDTLNLNACGDSIMECAECAGDAMMLLGQDIAADARSSPPPEGESR